MSGSGFGWHGEGEGGGTQKKRSEAIQPPPTMSHTGLKAKDTKVVVIAAPPGMAGIAPAGSGSKLVGLPGAEMPEEDGGPTLRLSWIMGVDSMMLTGALSIVPLPLLAAYCALTLANRLSEMAVTAAVTCGNTLGAAAPPASPGAGGGASERQGVGYALS